jgi:hypothetical protein
MPYRLWGIEHAWRSRDDKEDAMASSERTKGAATGTQAGTQAGTETGLAGGAAEPRNQEGLGLRTEAKSISGPTSAEARALEGCIISCLTNAQYHASREAYLDTLHRWFMFFVIALGAAALTDAMPKLVEHTVGYKWDVGLVKEICAAGAAILAALDLTFDLSNRARAHSMMKRRYFELLADLRENQKSHEEVKVCLERFSADEEPAYRVLFLACWNTAQQTVYGGKALQYQITFLGNLFKNWFRRPAADYPVIGG